MSSGDYNNDFNNDFSHVITVFIGIPLPGDLVDYVFLFPSKGDAQSDAVIGPYFGPVLETVQTVVTDEYVTEGANPGDFNGDFSGDFYVISITQFAFYVAEDGTTKYVVEKSRTITTSHIIPMIPGLNPDVLIFDRTKYSARPIPGYWCMVSQIAPFNIGLLNHPNVELIIDRKQEILGNASVLLNFFFEDITEISIMVSGIGQHTAGGLFGVPISIRPAHFVGYITEDGTRVYVTDDGTTVYVPEP